MPYLLKFGIFLALFLLSGGLFADKQSARCDLLGLAAHAPAGWTSQPMVELPEQMAGCLLTRYDEDDTLLGLQRLMSIQVGDDLPVEQASSRLADLELSIWEQMGFQVVEPLWRRDDVPMDGSMSAGFSSATALGMSAVIVESGLPQEIHLLLFHRNDIHYAATMLSPRGEAVEAIYQANLAAYQALLASMFVPD